MARMLGAGAYWGLPCSCCNGPRSVKVEKRREERAWRRELHAEDLARDEDDTDHP